MCLSLQLFPSVAQENPQCIFKIKWMQIFSKLQPISDRKY